MTNNSSIKINLKKAILKTLAYSDIFNYPLTKTQIWRFLITKQKITKPSFLKELNGAQKYLSYKKGLYCLKGREEIIEKRLQKEKNNNQKLVLGQKMSKILAIIPSVSFIGISGGLALKNASEDDDIDLFIIVKKNSLWQTRLIIIFLLEAFGVRRGRKSKNVKNKICPNMILTETALHLPGIKKDLFTAHELVQLLPIVNRHQIYEEFLAQNDWVKKYLPNGMGVKRHIKSVTRQKPICFRLNLLISLNIFESLTKKLQLYLIKKHQTTEIITNNLLAFHPLSHREKTLTLYKKRLIELKVTKQ